MPIDAQKNGALGSGPQKLALDHRPENAVVAFLAKTINVSDVQIGETLRHKVFGLDTVKNIECGITTMTFEGLDKRFQFPEAVIQGFLIVKAAQIV